MAVGAELRVEDLSFGYGGKPIGREVGFALEPGEVICLLGPNGGGKTTLFKTMLGLLRPLGGADIAGWKRETLARHIAYVPQAHSAFFPFTVRDIVLMGRASRVGLFATPGAADRKAAEAALAALGIDRLADRAYTEISGGERQLTLIARALAQEPRVLVMDEPTASLDFGNQIRVLEKVRGLARTGIAVLLSTHDPDHAFLCADRVALLHEGRLHALGAPAEVVTAEALRLLYGVEVEIVSIPESGRRICVPSLALF